MTIPIRNIYYLLCYAWNSLEEGRLIDVSKEEVSTYPELFARILETGVTHLLKRGLDRGYITYDVDTSSLRGKFDVSNTLKRNLLLQARVHCGIDELTYDVIHNRIIKSTIRNVLRFPELDHTAHGKDMKDRLLGVYRRLHDVEEISLSPSIFSKVVLHRNNRFYGFLLQVCRLIYDNLQIDENTGTAKFRDFLRNEKAMAAMFEKFVLNFYRREQKLFPKVRSELIDWQDVTASDSDLGFLPQMRTDISLESADRKIVIDTKYYSSTLQTHFQNESVHSGNLYQIFAYLKNLERSEQRQLEGVLLYPTVNRSLDLKYEIQGQPFRIVTVDLAGDWTQIKDTLLGILDQQPVSQS